MNRWSWHSTRALLLAVVLGVGVSLSCAQGAPMVAAIALAANDAPHGPGGCGGCDGCGDHGGMDAGLCLAVCATPAQGLMPAEPLTLPPASRTEFQIDRLHVSGQLHSPEHGPPKILALADA